MSQWAKRELLFWLLLEYEWQKRGLRVHSEFDMMLTFVAELCDHSGHASRPETTTSSWDSCSKKARNSNTSCTSWALIWISQHEEQAKKTHSPRASLPTFTHSYTVYESGKITPEQTVINNKSWLKKKGFKGQHYWSLWPASCSVLRAAKCEH